LEEHIGELFQMYSLQGNQQVEYQDEMEAAKGEEEKVKKVEGEEEEEERKEEDEEGKVPFNPNLYAWSKQTAQPKHLV